MKCRKETMRLYAVTDRAWTGKQSLMEQTKAALKGGVTCVQLREKELDEENFLKEALEMKKLCGVYGIPFFINDNVEIAVKCGADGIHVGQKDMEAGNVRALVGDDDRSLRPDCGAGSRGPGSGRGLSGSRSGIQYHHKIGCQRGILRDFERNL